MIIIKVTKNQGFTIFLEVTFFEKPQWEGGGGGESNFPLPSRFGVKKNQENNLKKQFYVNIFARF